MRIHVYMRMCACLFAGMWTLLARRACICSYCYTRIVNMIGSQISILYILHRTILVLTYCICVWCSI